MKKLIYLLLIVLVLHYDILRSLQQKLCYSEYQIKNIKFQNQHVVLTDEYIQAEDKVH